MSKNNYIKYVFLTIVLLILVSFFMYTGLNKNPELKYKDYNLVFVSFDALQANHVHNLGYYRNITPTIDELADSGFNFKNAISVSSWTVPSSMSWFTGVYPSQHKVVNKFSVYTEKNKTISNLKLLSPEIITLAELFKQNGYTTAGFTGDAGVNGVFGYDKGFDLYFDNTTQFSGMEVSVPKAIEWLKNNKDKRFFLFLHGYDFHGQYEPPDGFDYRFVDDYNGFYNGSREQQAKLREDGLENGYINLSEDDVKFWRAIYDEKISRADEKFKNFIIEYEKLGLMNKTIFILTSDHGTEFYEHGRVDHGFSLYDELIHVPLIIILPGKTGLSIENQVSSIDVMPTILDLLDINYNSTVENQMRGTSLVPLMVGDNMAIDAYSETDYRLYTHKKSVRTYDGWKFIYTFAEYPDKKMIKELYNLKNDPHEEDNLIEMEPRIAYELEQKLFSWMRGNKIQYSYNLGCSPVYSTQCK
ncbi:MAG: sulfatase [Candidatus Aenigmatarchaeota archaeon]